MNNVTVFSPLYKPILQYYYLARIGNLVLARLMIGKLKKKKKTCINLSNDLAYLGISNPYKATIYFSIFKLF